MGILNLLQFRTIIPKRMNFFAALLLASAFVATFSAPSDFDREVDVHWEEYKSHSPKHHHKTEEGARKENFKKSHKLIDDHNKGGNNFTMEHNHISDMHDHEKEHLYGLKMPVGMRTPVWTPSDAAQTRYLPSSVDYRTDACLQPVRNQGDCGSCWSFATVAPLEFSACKYQGRSVALSEQHLVDCDVYNHGCNGGWYTNAWYYLQSNGGSEKASNYAYTGAKESCDFNSGFVGARESSYANVAASESAMMTALQNGPLAVAINAVDSLSYYKSGVYFGNCAGQVNHAVVVVGYGSLRGQDYWVVRNSWGASWGQGGYVLFARGYNMCNIESYAASVSGY